MHIVALLVFQVCMADSSATKRDSAACYVALLVYSMWGGTNLHAVSAGAEKAGYAAVMVTVDSPRVGNREVDERNK